MTRTIPHATNQGSHSQAWPSIELRSKPPSGWMTPASTSWAATVLSPPQRMSTVASSQQTARLKALQLYVAGAATLGLVLLNVFDPGVAVVVGIALALGTGAAGSGERSRD